MKKDKKEIMSSFTANNIIIAGVTSYLAAIFTLPSMGIFSKLPAAFLFSFAASLVCTSKKWILSMMAVMPFILNLLYGFELKTAFTSAFVCVVAGWFGILARRAYFTMIASRKQNNQSIFVKSVVVLVISIVIGVLVQMVVL